MSRLPLRTFSRLRVTATVGLCIGLGGMHAARAQYAGQVSSIVVDARTGAVLSQQDPDLRRYPASLTKLMTLYLTFKAVRTGQVTLEQQMPVSVHAASMEPSKLGLRPGSSLTVEQAVLALVTKSANDAACALGEFLGGGDETRFAAMMTREAGRLGMYDTVFRNASGLPNPEQMTSARDLAVLARHLIVDYGEYYHYFAVPGFYFHGHAVPNHDPMLGAYPGADGLKTGYTDEAGHNLVTSAVRDNVRLIGVVMGAKSNSRRNTTMAELLDASFQTEGVAPAGLHPLVLARAQAAHAAWGRRGGTGGVALAAARRPVEVAEAPAIPASYIHIRRGHGTVVHIHPAPVRAHVHLVSMGHVAHTTHVHAKARS
ncbi:D-alanyl-D-alanine carboxypeptidase [Komagataeibacter rhaeticus]|uniref:D-alanyl-D-alanine carboxypeptidase family protein n=1 Tax=Komagataeibacter rhaeticus TaxID=215221 RepID=UPI0004D3FA6D|nr:D-alanyl-D-alanine carboxypeptidase family protein [Komagataeibacter rhaeticus]KDU95853.1 D-alanyl-D-alanine carboxypeptidase [Komagataeibacter rhaeticus AF1]MBL7240132.1 D-alanyl-D-alanine carboxypeptidase [Komagataeibacter rhaeticus]PYD54717.1 D-alanyl-D-alanine carboxypeptidase [Komagataeibacter rhaeticus]GBQ16265.1 D-alanyl-D-alanine serine-type carboxypeptidase [Komagataeibacter rhaeticus DSM 16663]